MKPTSIVTQNGSTHNGGHTIQVTLRRRLGKQQEMNGELLEDISSKMRSRKATQVKMRSGKATQVKTRSGKATQVRMKKTHGLILMISKRQKHKVGENLQVKTR